MIKWRKQKYHTVETIQKSNWKIVETEGKIPFYLQYICYVWYMCFSTNSRHSYVCQPLLIGLFLYSCETDYTPVLLKNNEKELFNSFNFTLRNWQRWIHLFCTGAIWAVKLLWLDKCVLYTVTDQRYSFSGTWFMLSDC